MKSCKRVPPSVRNTSKSPLARAKLTALVGDVRSIDVVSNVAVVAEVATFQTSLVEFVVLSAKTYKSVLPERVSATSERGLLKFVPVI